MENPETIEGIPEEQWHRNLNRMLMPIRRIPIKTDYLHRNQVKLVKGGFEYFGVLRQMINSAEHTIHLQTYIYDDDLTGRAITNCLKEAAARGVKVFMLVDAYASRALQGEFEEEMKEAGVSFRRFEPFFRKRNFYFGRRLHHKIIVTDNRYALVGGVNISDRYNDLPDEPAWLDWALYVEGEISLELHKVCIKFWYRSYAKAITAVDSMLPQVFPEHWNCAVKLRRNDWVQRHNQISRSYIEMLGKAEKSVTMMASYFLPGRVIRRNLALAAKRGVDVRLILAGTSDIAMAKHAERYIYRWLLRNGIQIYEYPKCVLHAKLSTYDRKWVTVGSYNVNNISAYASVELNLDVLDDDFAGEVQDRLNRTMQQECIPVTDDFMAKYNLLERFRQWCSYELYRLTVYLFTFYFKQRT